jgi:hypothetical protein
VAAAQGQGRESQEFGGRKRPDHDGLHRNWISFE